MTSDSHPRLRLPHAVELASVAAAVPLFLAAYAPSENSVTRFSEVGQTDFWSPAAAILLLVTYFIGQRAALLTFPAILFVRSLQFHQSPLSLPMLLDGVACGAALLLASAFLHKRVTKANSRIRPAEILWFAGIAFGLSAGITAIDVAHLIAVNALTTRSQIAVEAFQRLHAILNGILTVGGFFIFYAIPDLTRIRPKKPSKAGAMHAGPPLAMQTSLELVAQGVLLVFALWVTLFSTVGNRFHPFFILFLPIIWIALSRGLQQAFFILLVINVVLTIALPAQTAGEFPELPMGMVLLAATGICLGIFADKNVATREDLAEQSTYLQALLDNTPLAIVVHGTDGTINLTNPAFHRMFGFSRAEVEGHKIDEFVRAPDGSEEAAELTKAIVSGEPVYIKTSRLRKDGRTLNVEVYGVPLFVNNRLTGGVGIYNDVSEQTRLEEELVTNQKLKAVGQLAGGVAHDFNNILGIIQGYSESILEQISKENPLRDSAEEILQASKRGTALTRQLLAFGRKQVIQPQVMDLSGSVKDMAKMLGRLIGEDIELVMPPDLSNGRVKADPNQIEQVLLNLVVNARDAMPKGGRLTIETGNVYLHEQYAASYFPVPPGRYVMLAVCDTGIGMSPETRAKVFEPFFTTKEKGKGTGLGLATVYGIVQQSGGHIRVDSELGLGSAFRVFFPRIEEAKSEAQTESSEEGSILRGTETVLLLEDEASFRKMVAEFLRGAGYTVLVAESASEATQFIQLHPTTIHLLLTDVVMPDISGPQLARFLSALRPGLRVLFMSGYTDGALEQKEILAKDVAFIQKPFSWRALSLKLRETLEGVLVQEGTH
jgi:PAS domain S-box-containing protein